MNKLITLLSIASAFVLSSCELAFMRPSTPNTPTDVFEEAWTFTDGEYSFFDYKNINWDSIKTVFEPMVNDSMSDEELFDVMADVMFTLRDGHVNIRAPFDFSRNWRWFLDSPHISMRIFWREIISRTNRNLSETLGSWILVMWDMPTMRAFLILSPPL